MQILVLYHSKGGNTRKLAEATARGVDSVSRARAILKSTREATQDDFLSSAAT